MKRVTAYQSEDGEIHTSRAACRRADACAALRKTLYTNGAGRGGEWSDEMIVIGDFLIEHAAELAPLLETIAKGKGEA